MANNQFALDRGSSHPWAMPTINLRDTLLRLLNQATEIRGKAIQCYSPDNDWTNLENQFGLDNGDGQSFFAELDSMCAALGVGVSDAEATITRVGVLAALKQFADKVG